MEHYKNNILVDHIAYMFSQDRTQLPQIIKSAFEIVTIFGMCKVKLHLYEKFI